MGQIVSDDFQRGDGGLGANWTTQTGTTAPAIAGFAVTGAGSDSVGLWSQAGLWTNPSDYYSAIQAVSIAAGDNGGPVVRGALGLETGYQFNAVGGASGLGVPNQHTIFQIINGIYVDLARATFTVNANDILWLEVTGSATVTLTARLNGTAVIGPVIDTTGFAITAAGLPGFLISGVTGTTFDNWAAGTLTAIPALAKQQHDNLTRSFQFARGRM